LTTFIALCSWGFGGQPVVNGTPIEIFERQKTR
jgi:hypothetical protein